MRPKRVSASAAAASHSDLSVTLQRAPWWPVPGRPRSGLFGRAGVEIEHQHARAVFGEQLRGGEPEATRAGGAGDDGGPVFQQHGLASPLPSPRGGGRKRASHCRPPRLRHRARSAGTGASAGRAANTGRACRCARAAPARPSSAMTSATAEPKPELTLCSSAVITTPCVCAAGGSRPCRSARSSTCRRRRARCPRPSASRRPRGWRRHEVADRQHRRMPAFAQRVRAADAPRRAESRTPASRGRGRRANRSGRRA